MLHRLFTTVFLLLTISVSAQYKNDNVAFKTVDPAELCATLQQQNGYLLLDVRSRGEYDDTSSFGMNIGHLKGAKNINVRELGNRLSEISDYKDQPVFVYCSHSQRSRRAGKMLADSGFTRVININGGMTALHYTNAKEKDCLQSLVETHNKYAIISPADVCKKISQKPSSIFVLDVRPDSAFRHISADAKANAYGSLRQAVNIPLAELNDRLSSLPKDKEIILTDIYGDDAAKAAALLKGKGFDKVSVLIEGIDRWLYTDEKDLVCKKTLYESPVTYELINVTEFGRFANTNNEYLLLDVRSTEEFTNKHKDNWRNIGHLKNAIHIPASDIGNRLSELADYKNKEIVIYSFGSSQEVFAAANTLQQQGFKKVKVMIGGLFNLRWTAANKKGQAYLKDFVTDVPEANW
jgi:rhodanese-related sulfurtransferase